MTMDAVLKVTTGTCMAGTDWSKPQILIVENPEAER